MRALRFERFGPPDAVVRIVDAPSPLPSRDEFGVRVRAASLNPLDWKIVGGGVRFVPLFARPPRGVGVDFAGTIVAKGDRARGFSVGDDVFGALSPFPRQGSLAETIVVGADDMTRIVPPLEFVTAAALPIAGGTALQAIVDEARVQRGQRVLVVGAAGGVGSYAVQIARQLGAHVTGVASADNAPFVRSLGIDAFIDYRTADFTLGAERYDVVFDAAAATSAGDVRRVLAPSGIYLTTAPGPALYAAALRARLGSRQRFVGIVLRRGALRWQRLAELARAGAIHPPVTRSIVLDDVPRTLREMASGHGRGKIVVDLERSQ